MLTSLLIGSILVTGTFGFNTPDDVVQANPTRGGVELSFRGGEPFHTTQGPAHSLSGIEVGGARIATWEERGRPHYAISLDGTTAQRVTPTSYRFDLQFAGFDPLVATPEIPQLLRSGAGNELHIVQFVTQPLPQYKEAIREAGGAIQGYLPQHAYVVRMNPGLAETVRGFDFVRWVGMYEPAYRLEIPLIEGLLRGDLPAQDYNILVFDGKSAQKMIVSTKIRAIGGTIVDDTPGGSLLNAKLNRSQLSEVAQWNEVKWIDKMGLPETDMNIAREFGGANYIETIENFRGQGVRGEVMDSGVRTTHVDFAGRLTVRQQGGSMSHGTNVFGIVFGSGAGSSTARGMLPEGHGMFHSYGSNPTYGGAARYAVTVPLIGPPYFAVFQTNSWGKPTTTLYTADSATMDEIIFDLDLLILNSQSNTGDRRSRPEAWAKNMVSVGGVSHKDTLTRADDTSSGASIGPAEDGRIKPDLAHFYDNIRTTSSGSDTSYTNTFGGTSGATPITAGHFGLLFQMWKEGVFLNSAAGSTVFDARPHVATAKAMMINLAEKYPLTQASLTRVRQGWGTANLRNLYDNRYKMFVINESDVLAPLASTAYRLFVAPGEPEFKATMVYRDRPGNPSNQTQHRVNDLDLKVTSPNGTVYWGNNGLMSSNWSAAGGSANTKDTVENVFVENPMSGVWTVEVFASELNMDGHVATTELDSAYALVVSGVSANVAPASMTLVRGIQVSGALGDLHRSNDQRVVARPGLVLSSTEAPVQMLLEGQASTSSLGELRFRVESQAGSASVLQTISLYDYTQSAYVEVDARQATISDAVAEVTIDSGQSPSRFVSPTGQMRAVLSYRQTAPVVTFPWQARVDQVMWTIFP